jgi:hypothetical protein
MRLGGRRHDDPFVLMVCMSSSARLLSPPTAALKTQPYDLLRWSAAYFRCLSLDGLPPVKPRYEQENVFGSLTKGYLKVLLSQVSRRGWCKPHQRLSRVMFPLGRLSDRCQPPRTV